MALKSNQAISALKKVYNSDFAGGIRDSVKNIAADHSSIDAVWNGIKNAHLGSDGKLSPWRVAGTGIGVSAAARIVSGGGIYRDKDGNANLIGIPFI